MAEAEAFSPCAGYMCHLCLDVWLGQLSLHPSLPILIHALHIFSGCLSLTCSFLYPHQIVAFAAIVGLGLLVNAVAVFAIGLALYCSHCHLQHEIASLKRETPKSSNSLLETVTRERDALRVELAALRRSTHGPLPAGAIDAISRGPSPISPSTPALSSFLHVTNIPSATPLSAAPQSTAEPATTISLTPSFTNTPTDKANPTELTVTPTIPVINPQPVNQVALAAEARFGLINCPALAASAQSATTSPQSPTFTTAPTTKSNTSTTNTTMAAGARRALIKRAPAAISPSTPSPLPRPTATNTTTAAGATYALIKRAPAGAVATTTTTTTTTSTTKPAVKTSPAQFTPSHPPRLNSPRSNKSNKPSPLGRSWVTAPSTPSPPHDAIPTTVKPATPTAVKPATPTSKPTYTPDKATLAAAAIIGLISRGSAGKGPFTPTKLPGLDKTPASNTHHNAKPHSRASKPFHRQCDAEQGAAPITRLLRTRVFRGGEILFQAPVPEGAPSVASIETVQQCGCTSIRHGSARAEGSV
ncbi:hypothetical protein BJ741DRAFT_439590 [Chytriomyces cf. hyalinus JEL632]|nr:hypothetical protein BJ741DRAFT_439590 [Chytriomyces cf. hyalinus JEL632]